MSTNNGSSALDVQPTVFRAKVGLHPTIDPTSRLIRLQQMFQPDHIIGYVTVGKSIISCKDNKIRRTHCTHVP